MLLHNLGLRRNQGEDVSRRGREASDRLTQALITMASQGLRPHCSDPRIPLDVAIRTPKRASPSSPGVRRLPSHR